MNRTNQIQASAAHSQVTRKEIIVVAIVVAGAFVAILNQTILSPALPKLMETFNITAGMAQWVTTIYMLVNGIMVPITAFLIDRFPTRKLFTVSMLIFMVGTALAAVAPTFSALLIARVLQAMGAGIQLPLVAVVPMLIFPREKRGTAMGMAGIVMSCAPAAGPVVAGWAIDALGWRVMFIGMLPLALIVLILSLFFLTNVGELKHPHMDILSVILSTFAFGGMLYGLSSASTKGWGSFHVIVPLIVGVIALIWFIKRQLNLDEPLLDLKILRTHVFAYSAVINTVINTALAAGAILMPLYVQNVLGLSAFATGLLMMPGSVFTIFMSPISGLLFDRFGPRGISILGLSALTAATIGLSTIGTNTPIFYLVFVYVLQACGLSLANMPVNTWGINSLPNEFIAHGNAISNTGRQVGGSIGTALIVTIMSMAASASGSSDPVLASASGIRVAYGASACIAAVGLLLAIFKVRKTEEDSARIKKSARQKKRQRIQKIRASREKKEGVK